MKEIILMALLYFLATIGSGYIVLKIGHKLVDLFDWFYKIQLVNSRLESIHASLDKIQQRLNGQDAKLQDDFRRLETHEKAIGVLGQKINGNLEAREWYIVASKNSKAFWICYDGKNFAENYFNTMNAKDRENAEIVKVREIK